MAEKLDLHLKKGALHAELGIPEDQEIPQGKLEKALDSNDPTLRKRAQFAINAKKWHHESTNADALANLMEMTAFHGYRGNSIEQTGDKFCVGMEKNEFGCFDHDKSAVFSSLADAKTFIDGGKKGDYKTLGGGSFSPEPGKNEVPTQPEKSPKDMKPEHNLEESFVDLIRSDKVSAEAMFKRMMAEKVTQALESKRVELAQSIYRRG